jgi:hypothetical protein
MADQDQCVSISNCRAIVQPLSQQPIIPRVEVTVQERVKPMWERVADNVCRYGVSAFAMYLVWQVVYAFWSGAFARAVR